MSACSAGMPGRAKKELGEARRVRQVQTTEIDIYKYKLEKDFKYDVLEGCADAANITALAPKLGLMVFQPADRVYSWDLGTLADREQRKCAATEGKLTIMIFSVPFTVRCLYSVHMNFRGLERQKIRAALQLAARSCREQHRRSCLFLVESPPHSGKRKPEEINPVAALSGALRAISHACQFGVVRFKGEPIKKATKRLMNHPYLQAALSVKCHGDHEHKTVEGKNITPPPVYSDQLAMSICGATQDVARETQGMRFCKAAQADRFPLVNASAKTRWNPPAPRALAAQYQDYLRDGESPMELLSDTQSVVSKRQAATWRIELNYPIFEKATLLVPRRPERAQATKLPKARHAPRDSGWTR